MLLEVDGLSKTSDQGVYSDWATRDDNNVDMPSENCKLMQPSTQRITDLSGNGYWNDYDRIIDDDDDNDKISSNKEDTSDCPPHNNDGSINVCHLSLTNFRRGLITHFNIVFKQNKVK